MKKYIIAIICLTATVVFPQSNEQLLGSRIDSLLNNKFFQSSQIAIDVYDLSAHKQLFQKNEKLLLVPASNLKLLTTVTALNYLGDSYSFNTGVYYAGGIINGTLYGDLYLKGGCDPEFNISDMDSIASAVKQAGIDVITGNLYGDVSMMDSLFWGNGWMWDDDPSTDAPYLTPLNINKNSFGVILQPSSNGLPPAVVPVPATNYFKIENNAVTVPVDSSQTVKISRDWVNRKNTVILNGNIRNVAIPDSLIDTLSVNVYKPELYFMNLFKEDLAGKSIKLEGNIKLEETPDYAKEIFSFGRLLKGIIPDINKNSYNLGAEMLIYALAAKYYGIPATAGNGISMVDSIIAAAGCDPSFYRIVDGSGVSRYNLISTELMISLLKYIYYNKPSVFKSIYSSLPIAGVDGTLKKRMTGTPAQNNVHAKTGTLSGVTTLSGYLTSKEGHFIAFSIFIQNYIGSSDYGRNFQDKICNLLIDY